MEAAIRSKLREISGKHGIRVLYACETGSRAWGFPSPDSDYDVRMIYMHEPDWYLSLGEGRDTIEWMDEKGELDITGWDIRKSMRLLWKSNGAMLERIQSPVVYHEEKEISKLFREHAEKCFIPIATMHHYMGMAHTSFEDVKDREEVKLKKLFYSLRASLACKWILQKDSIPPIVFSTMVKELRFDEKLKSRIEELVKLKAGRNESYIHPAEKELNALVSDTLAEAEEKAPGLGGMKDRSVDLDAFFRFVIRNYWK